MDYEALYKQREKDKELQDITPTFVKFEKVDDFKIGRFIDTIEIESVKTGGRYKQYIFDTNTGRIKFHMGANADKEIGSVMKKGCVYFVQFKGQEEIGNNQSVNKWKVLLVDDTGEIFEPAPAPQE